MEKRNNVIFRNFKHQHSRSYPQYIGQPVTARPAYKRQFLGMFSGQNINNGMACFMKMGHGIYSNGAPLFTDTLCKNWFC